MAIDARPDPEAEIAETAARILAYLRLHRHAADTCKGIATWWIGADLQTKPETVCTALERLTEAGLVKALRLPTGEWLYGAALGESSPLREPQGPENG